MSCTWLMGLAFPEFQTLFTLGTTSHSRPLINHLSVPFSSPCGGLVASVHLILHSLKPLYSVYLLFYPLGRFISL